MAEERENIMQQTNHHHNYAPLYVEKLTLFFTPSGAILIKIGNQFMSAAASDVTELIASRLEQHKKFAELFNRGNGDSHATGIL